MMARKSKNEREEGIGRISGGCFSQDILVLFSLAGKDILFYFCLISRLTGTIFAVRLRPCQDEPGTSRRFC